jgi:hypothetical protein
VFTRELIRMTVEAMSVCVCVCICVCVVGLGGTIRGVGLGGVWRGCALVLVGLCDLR